MQQWAFDTAAVCNISASRDPAAAAVWSGNTQHGYRGEVKEETSGGGHSLTNESSMSHHAGFKQIL